MPDETADPRSETAKTLKEFPYFTARSVKIIDNHPRAWETCEVGVFQHGPDGGEKLIGTYERNYRFLHTFWWFRRGSRHFASYSTEYTATRVMEIFPGDGFKDIGGEEPASGGFCPVEFYVPDYREHVSQEYCGTGQAITDWNVPFDSLPKGCEFTKLQGTHRGRPKLRGSDGQFLEAENGGWVWGDQGDYESGWVKYPPDHGFVAGCIWGDDSSWKIQHLDLSRVEEGIIERDERFGYVPLPRLVRLRDAIQLYSMREAPRIEIAVSTTWDLQTGKMKPIGVAPWDEE
jgi:hypothetical protein